MSFRFKSHKKENFFIFLNLSLYVKETISRNNVKHVGIHNSVVRYLPVVGAKTGVVINGFLNFLNVFIPNTGKTGQIYFVFGTSP